MYILLIEKMYSVLITPAVVKLPRFALIEFYLHDDQMFKYNVKKNKKNVILIF